MPFDMYLSILAYGENTLEQVKFLQWQGSVIRSSRMPILWLYLRKRLGNKTFYFFLAQIF